MNEEAEDAILELAQKAKMTGNYESISYEKCHNPPGHYIEIVNCDYRAFIRRENNPTIESLRGIESQRAKAGRLSLIGIFEKESTGSKKPLVWRDSRPICTRVLKSVYLNPRTAKEEYSKIEKFIENIKTDFD